METQEKYKNAKIDDKWNSRHIYELYGIVCHSGSMSGGHYVAYVCYKYALNLLTF